jgi:hypothetical protein
MKFDKNYYGGLVRRPLMMVIKSDENSRALALNETVGENYSSTSTSLKATLNILTDVMLESNLVSATTFDLPSICFRMSYVFVSSILF